jgi:uncharacterized protein (TIGR03083 family)
MVADERRRAADLLAGLTAEQLRQPSLCAGWSVHEVAAHLISYLRFGRTRLYLGMLRTAADLDRVNLRLASREARRPTPEIVGVLRARAGCPLTIPRSGHDPILTDLVIHDLDMRVPLGIPRDTPEQRLRLALDHLVTAPALGFGMGDRLRGLRLLATDTGWSHGTGAPVSGPAESVLLAIAGRTAGMDALAGDGVPLLRHRLANQPATSAGRRVAGALALLVRPPRAATATGTATGTAAATGPAAEAGSPS